MPIPRIFFSGSLSEDLLITLDESNSRHLLKVLRLRIGESLQLFNGLGGEYLAILTDTQKQHAIIKVKKYIVTENESPLKIHLGQAISRGERMDFAVQKSVELGVDCITPLITERCGVQLSTERISNRLQHWQKVAISASEQSGRCIVPQLLQPCEFASFLKQPTGRLCLICHPFIHSKVLPDLVGVSKITLIIGPEGGFSEQEVMQAERTGFQTLFLGPRILRTETAAIAAITLLQTIGGDLRS